MTQDDIIRMAREVGLQLNLYAEAYPVIAQQLERFAALVAAHERDKQAEQEPSKQQKALQELKEWQRAYPLSVFPEPDCTKAQQALESVGMTLDSLSASTLRWALERVMKIVEEALAAPQPVSIQNESETDSSSSLMRTTVKEVELTDDEIEKAVLSVNTTMEAWITYRAVIAADREKNK